MKNWKLWAFLMFWFMMFGCFRYCKGQTYLHGTTGMANENISHCVQMGCGGTYYDDGFTGNYSNNVNGTYRTFCPNAAGMCMRATFSQFVVECFNGPCTLCYDILYALNGPTQNSPILWGLCSGGALPPVTTSTSTSGCLSFRFFSNASVRRAGWTAALSCVPCAANTVADNNDCVDATQICSNTSFVGASVGPGIVGDGCSGCNTSEHFTNWYRFCASTSGTLKFVIIPSNAGEDYDFALYGPNTTCGALGVPIRCSYAGVTGNTGLLAGSGDNSEDVLGNGWVETINIVAGDCYYLMLSQWSAGGSGFTLDFTGSTASLDCTPLPVGLLDFSCKDDFIEWTTASEINTLGFKLYGSDDGQIWQLLETVQAVGGNNTTSYQVLKNDNFEYFKLTEIEVSGSENLLKTIFCTSDKIDKNLSKFEVFNTLGQLVWTESGSFSQGALIASNRMISGLYIVRETKGLKTTNFKIYKP